MLVKLESVRRYKGPGSTFTDETRRLSNKFVGQVEKIFKNLPKPLEWLSFLNNCLPLVIDFCKEVQEASMQRDLNGTQTRVLQKLKTASNVEFQRLTARDKRPPKSKMVHVSKDSCQTSLKEMSAREIGNIADRAVKKEMLTELKRSRVSPPYRHEMVILMMSLLGIPVEKTAARFEINR